MTRKKKNCRLLFPGDPQDRKLGEVSPGRAGVWLSQPQLCCCVPFWDCCLEL